MHVHCCGCKCFQRWICLYDEIQDELADIKTATVSGWMEGESLAGGYGMAMKK